MLFQSRSSTKPLLQPRRILIVRFSAIGDVVHGLPCLIALRTRFPQAEIAWLVEETAAPLLHGHWALDRLMIVKKNWYQSRSTVALLRKRLKLFAPDITVDLQGLLKSSFAAWLSGSKHRIGFGGVDGREGSRWLNNIRVAPSREHVVDRNMQLLEALGVFGASVDFDLPECEMDRRGARALLDRAGLHGNFALLNVGAGWESKRWPPDRFGGVARYLLEQWNLPSLVLWAGQEEYGRAEVVVQHADGAAYLAPKTSLTELASLAKQATLFVGSDTGPLHIAAAVDTCCVGLFGPVSGRRNGPYGPQHRFIQATFPGQGRIRPRHVPKGVMESIGVGAVCSLCDEVLSEILTPSSMPLPPPQDQAGIVKKAA